jgi:hypothetical protein
MQDTLKETVCVNMMHNLAEYDNIHQGTRVMVVQRNPQVQHIQTTERVTGAVIVDIIEMEILA